MYTEFARGRLKRVIITYFKKNNQSYFFLYIVPIALWSERTLLCYVFNHKAIPVENTRPSTRLCYESGEHVAISVFY